MDIVYVLRKSSEKTIFLILIKRTTINRTKHKIIRYMIKEPRFLIGQIFVFEKMHGSKILLAL